MNLQFPSIETKKNQMRELIATVASICLNWYINSQIIRRTHLDVWKLLRETTISINIQIRIRTKSFVCNSVLLRFVMTNINEFWSFKMHNQADVRNAFTVVVVGILY